MAHQTRKVCLYGGDTVAQFSILLTSPDWCSRSSFFGGAVTTRDSLTIGRKHWYESLVRHGHGNTHVDSGARQRAGSNSQLGVTVVGTEQEKNKKKRSIIPRSYPIKGKHGLAPLADRRKLVADNGVDAQKLHGKSSCSTSKKMNLQGDARRPHSFAGCEKRRPLSERNTSMLFPVKQKNETDGAGIKLVRRRGTFYGHAQPPSAIQPIPQRPSYSDQSDVESLIDDDDVDVEDVSWVGELMNTLGAYATKDFSKIDAQRDSRMQASFDQIVQEEHQTAKIGLAVDRQEAERERRKKRRHYNRSLAYPGKDNKKKARFCDLIVCSSSENSDDDTQE